MSGPVSSLFFVFYSQDRQFCRQKDYMGKLKKRYFKICTLIGRISTCAVRTRDLVCLKSELSDGHTGLDNLLYENFGLSGEDMIRAIQKGEIVV